MKGKISIVIITVIFCLSCGKTDRVNTSAVKEEIKQREIKKISEVDIIDKALIFARQDEKAFLDCLVRNDSINLTLFNDCIVKRDSSRILESRILEEKDSVSLNELEASLCSAYYYDFKKGNKLYSNIQKVNRERMVYSFPLYKKGRSYSLTSSDEYKELEIVLIYYNKSEIVRRM